MIHTLPKEIQNKIFLYVGGKISRDDVASKVMSRKIGKSLENVSIDHLLQDNETLPPYIWWSDHLWNMPELYQITKSDRWCKDLFEFVVRNRRGMCPRELPLFLVYCWEIVYYLKDDRDMTHYGGDIDMLIARRFVERMYWATPWVLRERRNKTQIFYIDYDKFSTTYKNWTPWDDTQRCLREYL